MGRKLTMIVVVVFGVAVMVLGATLAAADTCSNLMSSTALHALPNTTITSAAIVMGTFTPPNGKAIEGLPSFCRVTATLKPTQTSDIKIEVWLPSEGWNGNLAGIGNGGLAGVINYAGGADGANNSLASAVKKGYASVGTNTGHDGNDTSWLPDESKERDYGYRSIHWMTVAAKTIVKDFYGTAAKWAYFCGCSTGGGQAVGEAQRYPTDYDGIVAEGMQNYSTRVRVANIWMYQVATNDPASTVPIDKLKLVTAAVLKYCGGKDALADGFLSSDPRTCRFDPMQLLCKAGQDTATCLTAPQVKTVRAIYRGEINRHTKQLVWPGSLPGSEEPGGPGTVGWHTTGMNGPRPFFTSVLFYPFAVLEKPDVDFHTMDTESALELAEKKFPFINHNEPDIDEFIRRGGKMIIDHGWADPQLSPINTIDYYGSVVEVEQRKHHLDQASALAETQKSIRLFMVPGMGHCGGGPGPDTFDAIGALDHWVDHSVAPDKIVATHLNGGVAAFSRPLCPFPQEAQYKGTGDRKDASSWVCITKPFTYDSTFYKVGSKGPGTVQKGAGAVQGE